MVEPYRSIFANPSRKSGITPGTITGGTAGTDGGRMNERVAFYRSELLKWTAKVNLIGPEAKEHLDEHIAPAIALHFLNNLAAGPAFR